jgi:hypothetical protein
MMSLCHSDQRGGISCSIQSEKISEIVRDVSVRAGLAHSLDMTEIWEC